MTVILDVCAIRVMRKKLKLNCAVSSLLTKAFQRFKSTALRSRNGNRSKEKNIYKDNVTKYCSTFQYIKFNSRKL
jgi:hypothetical protein